MPKPTPNTPRALWIGLGALILLALIGLILLAVARGGQRRLIAMHQARAPAVKAMRATRAPDPPGWELQEGSAAEHYQTAFALWAQEPPAPTALVATLQDLAPLALPTQRVTTLPSRTDAVPPVCQELGFGATRDAPGSRYVTTELCEHHLRMRPALERLEAGSRMRDNLSPMAVFEPWLIDPETGSWRNLRGFFDLNNFLLLDALLAALRGEVDTAVERLLAAMRYNHDLAVGARLDSALLGSYARMRVADALDALLQRGVLGPTHLERIDRELAWLIPQRPSFHALLTQEFVASLPGLLPPDACEELDLPPGSVPGDLADSGGMEHRLWRRNTYSTFARIWEELLSPELDTFEARQALYTRLDAELSANPNPLIRYTIPSFIPGDVTIEASWSRLALLRLAAQDRRYALEHGQPAPDLATLRAAGFEVPDDPMTRTPFLLYNDPRRAEVDPAILARLKVNDVQPRAWLRQTLTPAP